MIWLTAAVSNAYFRIRYKPPHVGYELRSIPEGNLNDLPFPLCAKRGQITQCFDDFRRREASKGLQSFVVINGK